MKIYKNFRQGVFKPKHPDKYKGLYPITYRSSYELAMFLKCDDNPNIVEWSSESIAIPYRNPAKMDKNHNPRICKYYPDLTIKIKGPNNTFQNFLIEIKPSPQLKPPSPKNRKNKSKLFTEQIRYAQNLSKWEAAKKWAELNGYKFTILTEKEIFNS